MQRVEAEKVVPRFLSGMRRREREKMNLVWRKRICLEHVELRYVWNIQIEMFGRV